MASDVFYNRLPYTQRRAVAHQRRDSASAPGSSSSVHPRRSVGTTRSGGALTFPPLYLDPIDPLAAHDPSANPQAASHAQQPGNFVLGSTFYHHPELNALVSNHLVDASANAPDGASGTGHAFLSTIFANRDGAHDDDSDGEDAALNAADAALAVPRPKITAEFVSLNEDLVPASLDMHGDMLPADQHPSYPFGNLFGPLGGAIAADSAIVGGAHGTSASSTSAAASLAAGLGDAAETLGFNFGGGLEGLMSLGRASHGRRGAVANGWNPFINKASRTKLVGSAGAQARWNDDAEQEAEPGHPARVPDANTTEPSQADTLRAAKKLDLSPNLLFRTSTATVLSAPTWPFRRHGPGATNFAALLRPSSNIFGTSPASQAVAATLGGLPASANIIGEVWSDLALEELLPRNVGDTAAVRHLGGGVEEDAEDEAAGAEGRGKKRRRSEPEADAVFARRAAAMEADPLDLLGPISREIRGQAAVPWGTASAHATQGRHDGRPRRRRRRDAYSDQSEDEAAEAEHDDPEQGYAHRDRVRYSFALPPATFTWTEADDSELDDDAEGSRELRAEPDGIGFSTAKRIFVNEERDRLLPPVYSRAAAAAGAIEPYRVRGVRANQGLLPRPPWTWRDGTTDADAAADLSVQTELSASTSHPTDLHSTAQEEQGDEWQQHQDVDDVHDEDDEDDEEAQIQRALLMQYEDAAAQREDSEEAAQSDDDQQYDDEDEEDEVGSFD
ncbi:hypothetical protein PANT_8c00014 [Moesziomyces antarcticus T-34]|uniref:Uncharacterized protein n=1 Tax=Pseudozyma antarctica (strain T-34) TaxID=1151754 RepID=M9LUL2_PSEA3|nr:hypothetical protein PANT_8c00014 [Moesziomyces antarcticus T-34]